MYADIKKFLGHSSVYFVGNALNRLGVFLLLPLYTRYLTPAEYGTLELVLVTVSIMQVFLGMRFGHAALRFYFEYEKEADKKRLISTSLISLTAWCLLLTGILIASSNVLSKFIYSSPDYSKLLVIGFSVMFFEVVNEVPFAYLRAREKSVIYVVSSCCQMLLRVGLNLYIVMVLNKGVEGILTGNLIGAGLVWVFLCGYVFSETGVGFNISYLRSLWKYCYPLVIAAIPALILRNADRVFLGWYASLESVGIYALAMRFGIAMHSFLIEPFQMGFGPFRFSIMKQENAKDIYSRIMSYYMFVAMFAGLMIALFSREVIEIMASESYLATYKIIPVIVLTTVIGGMTYIFQTGMFVEKKTVYMPYIATANAVIIVAALFILVPLYGLYGAAVSLLLAITASSYMTYRCSQKCFPIKFEYGRMSKTAVAVFILYSLSVLVNDMDFVRRLIVKTILAGSFPLLLALFRFYRQEEIDKFCLLASKAKIQMFSRFDFRGR